MTQSEFIKLYCENSKITEKMLNDKNTFAIPCDCGQDDCFGFAMVNKNSLKDHCNLYIKNSDEKEFMHEMEMREKAI